LSSFSPEWGQRFATEEDMKAQRSVKSIEPTRFEERGPLTVAGFAGIFTPETRDGIPALWMRLAPHIGSVPGQVGNVAYGVSSMHGDKIDYTAGVEVSDGAKLPEGFTQVRITAKTFAVFSHRGHVSTIPEIVGQIGNDWLPHSGWAIAEGPQVVERYGEGFDPKTSSGVIEIWIPLKG
jgi:AraC family transcriptional regulator